MPHRYEYFWADNKNVKKPLKCSAPDYMEYLMTWVQDQLDDEKIFPSRIGKPFYLDSISSPGLSPPQSSPPFLADVDFPADFANVVKTIFKRLFRVYAHIYHAHLPMIESLGEEAHLNTCFKHFLLFSLEFELIDKNEMAPLAKLIEQFEQRS